MSRHVSKWGTSKNPDQNVHLKLEINESESQFLRRTQIYIVSNASLSHTGHAKKKTWDAPLYTKNRKTGSNFVKKNKSSQQKSGPKKLQAAERAFLNSTNSSMVSCNQGGRTGGARWGARTGVASMPGEPNRVFFRRCVLESNLLFKGDFFFETHHKKNVMKKKIDSSVMDFLVTVEFYAPFFSYYL